jgi:hypothetical protein
LEGLLIYSEQDAKDTRSKQLLVMLVFVLGNADAACWNEYSGRYYFNGSLFCLDNSYVPKVASELFISGRLITSIPENLF